MQHIIFCQGLPASGKSTWSKQYCKDNLDYVRISRDDLRNMRGVHWLPIQESMITVFEKACFTSALQFKKNVIVDATNFNVSHVNEFKKIALEVTNNECEFEVKFFDTPLDECIKRDAARKDAVGEKVIRGFYDKYLKPKPIEQSQILPRATLYDLDGTLAIHNGRSPYDFKKCNTDLLCAQIADICKKKSIDSVIIFISGRDDSCYNLTQAWLQQNNLTGLLFMRKTGDKRPDEIVKQEIFEKNIKNKYYVEFVMDDRPKVIRMWKRLGLFVFNVGDGHEF
jgi:predicted kinase